MSYLLYLHSFSANAKRKKPVSPMGLSAVVLDAWKPRFKKLKASKWLETLKEETFTLDAAQVTQLHEDLTALFELTAPKLACKPAEQDEFVQTLEEELLQPVEEAAKKKLGLYGLWT